jgi:hypothetical protein
MPSTSPATGPTIEPVRYIVVVHGMGTARFNETVLSVVDRFAEARSDQSWPPPPDILSLGMACGQTGTDADTAKPLWLEFEGIAANPNLGPAGPFVGQPAPPTPPGQAPKSNNLRFVDLHWKDLLTDAWPAVGQKPDTWLDALLGRLRRENQQDDDVPQWVLETLGVLRQTVGLVDAVLRFKYQSIDDLVFGQYLGDVQLYGEYPMIRGQAVWRFHQRMAAVVALHKKREREQGTNRPARFTVIAHSLGTVMALDSLLYATANRSHLTAAGFAFPGYGDPEADAKKKPPDTKWIDNVDAFVTLGSPIEKFLTIWWLNYEYLNDPSWIRPASDHRIDHFNYCEEQDPVGQHLSTLEETPAYKAVFRMDPAGDHDKVYARYVWPGLAHTAYWHDLDLFRWIAYQAVDRYNWKVDKPPPEPDWFTPQIQDQILFISYLLLPIVVILADTYAFTLACYAEGTHAAIAAAVALFVVTLLGRYLIDLQVWWRQLLRAKHNHVSVPDTGRDLISPSSAENRLRVAPRPFLVAFLHYIASAAAGSVGTSRYRLR